jgi:hypothetical protein
VKVKNAAISLKILAKIAAGFTVAEAIDAVLGAGTYACIASAVYDELRAKT